MIKTRLRKPGLRCLWLSCLFMGVVTLFSTTQARDLILLATPQAPFKYEEDGELKGIDVEIITEVMKRLDLGFRLRLIKSDARIQEEARLGKADMLLLFSKKQSRLDYLIYPEKSYIDLTWNFFLRREDAGKYRFNQLSDLKGVTIGATKDVAYTPEFWQAGLLLDITTNNDQQITKLLAGRFDLVPLNTISTLYEEKRNGNLGKISYLPHPLKSTRYYNVFTKASDFPDQENLIRRYDEIIGELQQDGTIQKIMNKYLGDPEDMDITG
ncbi:substrate-binding periplasmic protein [Kiloniella laminariae]|uniref:substrate-binding periplasmic protein n=1 Tax=Kiloniella laminariae TaxID=454162 RepID=UPI000370CC25|nr:ABC transporter substrate-binding protein [Kiloniella laminariae]